MNRVVVSVSMLLITVLLCRAGDKGELQWRNLTTGLEEAKKSNKKILLDIYTDWCGWCKKLDKDVYANEMVASYLKQQYVAVKLNAESDAKVTYKGQTTSEMELAQAFGIRSYPTIIFLDAAGEPINSLGGYVNAEKFLPIVKFIGEDYYKKMTWDQYREQNGVKSKISD
ncbi:MAG: thioredoxin fold domain-containing protein [Ignavibacteriales bacterium]|nr:thioredoxin fold domain-containing protein [Ignavibacteriales bacterium]